MNAVCVILGTAANWNWNNKSVTHLLCKINLQNYVLYNVYKYSVLPPVHRYIHAQNADLS